MRNSKLGLKALGLSVLGALSLMAFFAVGAQAQSFLINLANALLATATGEQEGSGTLLVPTKSLTIKCNGGTVEEGKISSTTEGLAKVTFKECAPFVHKSGAAIKTCIIPGGKITATAKLLPGSDVIKDGEGKVISTTLYVLAEPDSPATLFTTVTFEKEKGCALPLSNPVKGSVAASVSAEKVEQLITFSEANQTLFGGTLAYGEAPAFVIASATVKLTNAHAGLKFGVL